jgi:hypothetical protein
MTRPDLDIIRARYAFFAPIDPNYRVLVFNDIQALLAYIAELENLVNSMGDEWEAKHGVRYIIKESRT